MARKRRQKETLSQVVAKVIRGNLSVCFNLALFEKFYNMGYSYKKNMSITDQGMSDWAENEAKLTSHNNFKRSFTKRPQDLDRVYLCK